MGLVPRTGWHLALVPGARDGRYRDRDYRDSGYRPRYSGGYRDTTPRVRVRDVSRSRYDLDRDGIPDNRDRDMDGDRVTNTRDRYPRDPRHH